MNIQRIYRGLLLAAAVAAAGITQAAQTDIATVPMITSSSTVVRPNLLFVLDDSGSMDWDYMPDWVNDSLCRSAGATFTTSGTFDAACSNHPPYRSPQFNGVYYNPEIRYMPPAKADGTQWPSQTSANTSTWSSVKDDAYGIQYKVNGTTTTTNLVTGTPDTEWCTDSNYTDCLRNGNYVLPGTVNSKAYIVRRNTTASGTVNVAIGNPSAATVESRTAGPHYYRMVAGEWCDAENLRNCRRTADSTFKYAAPLRWCKTEDDAKAANPTVGNCQAVRIDSGSNATFSYPRYPTKFMVESGTDGTPATPASPAKMTFSITMSSGCDRNNLAGIRSLTVTTPNVQLLDNSTSEYRTGAGLAADLVSEINADTSRHGYSASVPRNGNTVTITAPVSAGNLTSGITLARTGGSSSRCTWTLDPAAPVFSGYTAGTPALPGSPGTFAGSFERVDIVSGGTYTKYPGRTDCGGTSCTYEQEMTNFANWWTYYRTRMQSMKSSAGTAFSSLSSGYRVGYLSINNNTSNDFLNLNTFDSTQRTTWFSKLTSAVPNNSTPLRVALARAGRLYAGKLNGATVNGSTARDPMQYSCQRNFTLLSTDGYWNESTTPKQMDGTTDIGDQDGSLDRPFRDGSATSNSLSDVAAYYYNTDLRPTGGVCAGTDGSGNATGIDLCDNGTDSLRPQRMNTFTIGLGASGFMQFTPDYKTATSGDFYDITRGTLANPSGGVCAWGSNGSACEWPAPASNLQTTIDDLWHAAVNGRGTYFSARNPNELYEGLSDALRAIGATVGAAAAATTSNPNISAGDDLVFISSFKTQEWTGELKGKKIDLSTGALLNSSTDWSAQVLLNANTGRAIKMRDPTETGAGVDNLKDFDWSVMTDTEKAYFQTTNITASGRGLSQFCTGGLTCLSATDQTTAAGERLVQYLRGSRSDEGSDLETNKFFRERVFVLGDIVSSEAVYIKKPQFNYADTGYATFKDDNKNRRAMVYVGANDGMLHAFDAASGAEVWAYVPSMVLPDLYRLADKTYATKHRFFVDASPVIGDIKIGSEWRTILVGGLGAGGRGYYALDITDPDAPKSLWEFTDDNLGLTFGKAEITKIGSNWVVMFGSGYNNVSPGDGIGRLYVLNAATGTPYSAITATSGTGATLVGQILTSAGSTTTPSGLAHIRAWVDYTDVDNTTLRVYGGDTLGNVWRFDVNNNLGATGYDAQRLASLRTASGGTGAGSPQPITTRPELGLINGTAVVYVGTGRYLGETDHTDSSQQSIYAIKDALGSSSVGNPRDTSANFVKQTLSTITCPTGSSFCGSGETVRTVASPLAVDWATKNGWFIDLPVSRERANTDAQLALGTLVVTTNVVNPSVCGPGTSYINFFDYKTGASVAGSGGVTGRALSGEALATRPAVVRLPNGKIVALTRLSNDSRAATPVPVGTQPGTTRRISWRELAVEQ